MYYSSSQDRKSYLIWAERRFQINLARDIAQQVLAKGPMTFKNALNVITETNVAQTMTPERLAAMVCQAHYDEF